MQASAFLRQETKDLHRQTEAVALGREIMEHSLNLEQYRSLIAKNQYLHKILEPLLQQGLADHGLTPFQPFLHPRLDALQADADLLFLRAPDFDIPAPALTGAHELLGGLYVLLGSNLGGRVIYRSLKENSKLNELSEFHFYSSSGKYPAKEWPQFCRLLDQHLQTQSDLEAAKRGAEAVFRFVREVYCQ